MPVPTPEHDNLRKVQSQSQTVGEFLEWLQHEQGIIFACHHEHTANCYDEDEERACGLAKGELTFAFKRNEALLAEFFNIDLKKIEKEKRAILAELREAQKEAA